MLLFLIKEHFIINPVNSKSQVCFARYIIKDKKSLPITGLEATTSVIAGKCLNECATAASIYIDLR